MHRGKSSVNQALARFVRLNLAEDESRRLKSLAEEKSEEEIKIQNRWERDSRRHEWEAEQLAYIAPYRDEYDQYVANGIAEQQAVIEDKTSEVETKGSEALMAESRKISQLLALRGGRRRVGATGSRESTVNFELTSTVLPPSDPEFNSNINVAELRSQYFQGYRCTKDLPIYESREYLINSINSYSVVIVEGATGCGKTTQVPMYILEDAILDKNHKNSPVIYVTQPRRIAARSIANRICDEHGWSVGSIVGYQIGMEKRVGPQTVLVFCTAGVLLQKLIQEKSLSSFTHIIIDEAHERDADTDLLLMMIRTLMRKEMSFFRLIVMSATMDMEKLKRYFSFKTQFGHNAYTTPSICKIGASKKPRDIKIIYFDKLRSFKVDEPIPEFDACEPELHEECLRAGAEIILDVIPHLDTFNESTKSTLVFLPGLAEIMKLHRILKAAADNTLDIIPLHSCLPFEDQTRVFLPSQAGTRKVILATNIAESSITVKDAGFIVDFCLTKNLMKDEITKFPTLKLQWSTQDKCTQRSGRTGRCCAGKVFRLVTRGFYDRFPTYAQPELLTAPLELSVLRVKNFGMGEIKALFAVVLDPPPLCEIKTAVLELKQIGALASTFKGQISNIEGDLTELGKIISSLPIDVHLSKLIVLAAVLDVLEDAIIIAACLSTNRTIVKHLYNNFLESYKNKLTWANGSFSDLFVSLDLYKEKYLPLKYQSKDSKFLARFCDNHHLDERKLQEVSAMVEEIRSRLENVNIRVYEQPNRTRDVLQDELMLKVAICAAFYPNYFLTNDLDPQEVKKSICGLDPTKTLVVHGLPVNEVPLYRSQIMSQLEVNDDMEYIADVSRALLVLNEKTIGMEDKNSAEVIGLDYMNSQSTPIDRSMFLAIKTGECNRIIIREYQHNAAYERLLYYRNKRKSIEVEGRLIPSLAKIVVGRRADNSRLIEANDEEYVDITNKEFFYEVDFNEKQNKEDLETLYVLEDKERNLSTAFAKSGMRKEENHPIFRTEYKQLRGPTSPIQLSFRAILEKSRGFNVDIEYNSVNSILLNPDYEKPRRQMMVAATVGQSKKGRVMARDTTLMPNVRGLPTIMALMFAQYYRIIYNEQTSSIAGAIFGLGWDANDRPIDEQYQVELNFDVHITKDDIELINHARRMISELIKFLDVSNPGAPRAEMQERLRAVILSLIRKRRYPMNEVQIANIDWSEGNFLKEKHNLPKEELGVLEEGQTRVFLPLMVANREYKESDFYASIRKNLADLNDIYECKSRPPVEGIKCLLCKSGIGEALQLQNKIVEHLFCQNHLDNLKLFTEFEEILMSRVEDE